MAVLCEDYFVLRCEVMQSDRMLPTFWRENEEKNEAASGLVGDGGPLKLGPNF
jgi:hypothetical protein